MKVRRIDFSPDEWIGGTVGLGNAERGLYITACALIYSRGGAVSVDHLRAACRDHGHSFKHQLKQLLALGKLVLNEGQITSKRCSNELQKASERSINAQQNVSKRWGKVNKINDEADQSVLPPCNANHQPSTINHQLEKKEKVKKESRSAQASLSDREFEDFWRECPKKVGRGAARKAWDKARQMGVTADALLAGIKRFAALKAGAEAQFIAHPATWLNQQRWLDEVPGEVVDRPIGPPPMIQDEHGNWIDPLDGRIVSKSLALSEDAGEGSRQEWDRVSVLH